MLMTQLWQQNADSCTNDIVIQGWLTQPYILSEALERFFPIELRLIEQSVRERYPSERVYPLEDNRALVREIALQSNGSIKTLGRVIIPLDIYNAFASLLDEMVDTPIGKHWLYNHKGIKRSGFEFSLIVPHSEYWPFITASLGAAPLPSTIVSRRSFFWLNEKTHPIFKDSPIIVTEFFVAKLPCL